MFKNKDEGEGPNKRLLPTFVQYTEWLRLSCLSVFLYVSGINIPVIGVVLTLTSPAPISLLGIRQGTSKAFLAVVFIAAILFPVFGDAGSMSFILSTGFLGIALGAIARKTNSAGETIFGLIIIMLISKLILMWYMVNTRDFNPFILEESSIDALMKSLNVSSTSDDIVKAITEQMKLLTPSFLIMAAGLDVFVNYLLVSKMESRRQKIIGASPSIADEKTNEFKIHPLPPFELWSFPRSVLSAFFTAFLITLFNASDSSSILLSAELNLKVLTSVMFFIQGISFAWWWMLHKNFSYWARLSIFFFLMFIPIFSMGLIILGIMDIIINIREKIRRDNK